MLTIFGKNRLAMHPPVRGLVDYLRKYNLEIVVVFKNFLRVDKLENRSILSVFLIKRLYIHKAHCRDLPLGMIVFGSTILGGSMNVLPLVLNEDNMHATLSGGGSSVFLLHKLLRPMVTCLSAYVSFSPTPAARTRARSTLCNRSANARALRSC